MTENAPAKINLGLHVLRKRKDGYHDLETVMVRLAWFDTLEVAASDTLSMSCSDPLLPTDASNLCMKAAHAMSASREISSGASLHLTKRIPTGAGLGGGSSDAAATLRLLARLWKVSVSDHELAKLAAPIGADVPFFLGPSPALAEGIGERLSPISVRLPFTFVVLKPERSVSTAEAYRWVQPSAGDRPDLVDVVCSLDLERWRSELVNDFEPSIMAQVPEVGKLKERLYELGAGYAAMSGSGSAVYGVFDDLATAQHAETTLNRRSVVSWIGGAG